MNENQQKPSKMKKNTTKLKKNRIKIREKSPKYNINQ